MEWFTAAMAWLRENAAALSAVVVPVFLGVIGPLRAEGAGGRVFRRVRRLAQLRSLLPDGSDAAVRVDGLLASEVDDLAKRHERRLNRENLAAIIIMSLLGGAISAGLVTWAQVIEGVGSTVVWVLFWLWTVSVLTLVLVGGLSKLYDTNEQ
ncbi:hypothetical protein [uncultured Microbacterium sp.]|uniref:hypothetical protein n=1 Tax=uncultured Microbacterium sp. TaxID=191216 RepID=UPI0025FCB613|nr:hypothetical protein [uncultured Microbacterium sp.]